MIVTEAELRVVLGLASSITEEERAVLMLVHRESEQAVRKFLGYDPEQAERTVFLPRGDDLSVQYGTWDVNSTHAVFDADGGTDELIAPHLPIRSISSLKVDRDGRFGTRSGSFGASTAWTEGVDFYPMYEMEGICRSGIIKAQTSWPVVAGSVKLVYTAGLSADELSGNTTNRLVDGSGIAQAVKLTAGRAMEVYMTKRKRGRAGWIGGNVTSESLGDYSYSVDAASAAAMAAKQLPAQAQDAAHDWKHYGVMAL